MWFRTSICASASTCCFGSAPFDKAHKISSLGVLAVSRNPPMKIVGSKNNSGMVDS